MILTLTVKYGKKAFLILGLIIMLIEYHYYLPREKGFFTENNITYGKFYQFNPTIPEMPSNNNLFRIYFDTRFGNNSSIINEYGLQGYENNVPNVYAELTQHIYGWSPRFWQIANVKYVITTNADFATNMPELIKIKTVNPAAYPDQFLPIDTTPYYVYEVKNYLPRFYVPKIVELCSNPNCWIKENAPELVIAKDLSSEIINPKKGININIKKYNLNNIEIEINTPRETFIASSENYEKGWSLSVNNKTSKIYFISGGLRGFIVPAGRSIVKMDYFPPYVIEGAFLSVIGILFSYSIYVLCKKGRFEEISSRLRL
jgi:hypothetical protein